MDRRKFLDIGLGCVVATAGVAGCLGRGSEEGQKDDPTQSPYERWVSTDVFSENGPSVQTYEAGLLERVGGVGDREPLDLGYVPDGAHISSDVDNLELRRMTGAVSDEFGVVDPTDGEGSVDRIHDLLGLLGTSDGGTVIEGSFDEDAVTDSLAEAGATDEGEYGGYRLYSGHDESEWSSLFAVSAEILLTGKYDERYEDPTAPIRALIDAGNGDATPYTEADDAYGDLVSTLEDDPMVVVNFTPEDQQPDGANDGEETDGESNDADPLGRAIHTDFDRDRATAGIAFRYGNEADVYDEAWYEEWMESTADEWSVEIDGPLVTIDATYTREEGEN